MPPTFPIISLGRLEEFVVLMTQSTQRYIVNIGRCTTAAAFDCYNTTLISLLNKYAPFKLKHSSSARTLERRYRRLRSNESYAAWRDQFQAQRSLFESKFTTFWLSTVEIYNHNQQALWRAVEYVTVATVQASYFNTFSWRLCHSLLRQSRQYTATAAPPCITTRLVPPLSCFEPVTVGEIAKLLNMAPCK